MNQMLSEQGRAEQNEAGHEVTSHTKSDYTVNITLDYYSFSHSTIDKPSGGLKRIRYHILSYSYCPPCFNFKSSTSFLFSHGQIPPTTQLSPFTFQPGRAKAIMRFLWVWMWRQLSASCWTAAHATAGKQTIPTAYTRTPKGSNC